MTKVRKLKRKKRFQANVNRKRLRNKQTKLPTIECKQIKEAWDGKQSTRNNLSNMGLVYDPNTISKKPNAKKDMLKVASRSRGNESDSEGENAEPQLPTKQYIADTLEADAKHPRQRLFRLPNSEVRFATYMMDKHGDDFKAMSRDRKNIYQLTWKQIKAKINRFKSVPEQYAEYLVEKGEIVLDEGLPLKKPRENQVKKSQPKKKRKSKIATAIWGEESVLDDIEPVKKVPLFPDDDDDDECDVNMVEKFEKELSEKIPLFNDQDDDDDVDETINTSKPSILRVKKKRKYPSKF